MPDDGSMKGVGAMFGLERLTGTLGAEVSGLDLSAPLPEACIDALGAALARHRVLFFRDQQITQAQHVAFGRRFGPLEVHPLSEGVADRYGAVLPEIVVVESSADKQSAADAWHSDVTWRPEPSLGSILRCLVSPPVGGDTLWADMVAAYEALDDATRSRISGMTASHSWSTFRPELERRGVPDEKIRAMEAANPPVEHPVVRTHPVTGEKILYVNANFTGHIVGMKADESRALLDRLFRQASIPEMQVRFRWRPNSIAFWDNRSTQHYAVPDFFPQHRRMERVTVAGDRPY